MVCCSAMMSRLAWIETTNIIALDIAIASPAPTLSPPESLFDEQSNHEAEDVVEESEHEDEEEEIHEVDDIEAFAGEFLDDVDLDVLLMATGNYVLFVRLQLKLDVLNDPQQTVCRGRMRNVMCMEYNSRMVTEVRLDLPVDDNLLLALKLLKWKAYYKVSTR